MAAPLVACLAGHASKTCSLRLHFLRQGRCYSEAGARHDTSRSRGRSARENNINTLAEHPWISPQPFGTIRYSMVESYKHQGPVDVFETPKRHSKLSSCETWAEECHWRSYLELPSFLATRLCRSVYGQGLEMSWLMRYREGVVCVSTWAMDGDLLFLDTRSYHGSNMEIGVPSYSPSPSFPLFIPYV
jgi:hypothetical protein